MKITAVEAIPFAIPYAKPLKFASGEVHTAEHVLVRVHTDDGVVGVAEAPPRAHLYCCGPAPMLAAFERRGCARKFPCILSSARCRLFWRE